MTKLKIIRNKCQISASELARRLKITRASICRAEKKGLRSVSSAKKYAAALSCKPEEILEF